jgi:hypothetical protein
MIVALPERSRHAAWSSLRRGFQRSWPIGEFGMAIQPSARAAARSSAGRKRLVLGCRPGCQCGDDGIEGIVRALEGLLMQTVVQPRSFGLQTRECSRKRRALREGQ